MPCSDHIREQERLASLALYDVLDTPQEETFDRVTRLARRFFQVPMSTITLVDGHRAWLKSAQGGLPMSEAPKDASFCSVTIREARPLVVRDTLQDERFKENPFVVGDPSIRFYAGAPLHTPDGQNIGALCVLDSTPRSFEAEQVEVLTDLARIVMSELELRKLATTDGLTGALSRRAFREEASRALALAIRHRHELTCITFDLDHFKNINDAHGHAMGDLVLEETTKACRVLLRKSDLVGRLGGEEFAILLPYTGPAAALKVAEKLRMSMTDKSIVGSSAPIHFSASFGLASLDRSVLDIETLLQHADAALYDAKAQGRNRCVVWQTVKTVDSNLRRRVFKAGRIAFNGGASTIDCTVRGLSDAGASLDVISTAEVPSVFKLRIDADDLSRGCRIVAKRDRSLEVEFA